MTLPNFLIVGAMRSGTTWLARCLGQHPDVFVAETKEVHYFDADEVPGVAWYERHFERANGARAVGEATPNYLYDPVSIARISHLLPDVRLIAILRDPCSRAYSHYWLNRARRNEPLSFEEAVRAEPERIAASRTQRFRYSYVDRGRYAAQLRALFERVEPSRVHVALFDDFRVAPETGFAQVCDFIGVTDVPVPMLHSHVNGYQEFRSVHLRYMTNRLAKNQTGRAVRSAVGKLNAKTATYPPMSESERRSVLATLTEDICDLEQLLRQDLSAWIS